MAFCPKCGAQVGDLDSFCPKCGASRTPHSDADSSAQSTPKKSTPSIGQIVGCGCLLLVLVPLLVVGRSCSNAFKDVNQSTRTSRVTCTADQFKLSKLRTYEDSGFIHITGIIANTCNQSAGVQLKWTIFDKNGNVISDEEFWPASTNNIPPHSQYPFEYLKQGEGFMTRYTIGPISADHW